MSKGQGTYRWLGAISLAVVMVLLLSSLSSLVSYFGTGSSKDDIYHADERYFEKARPYIKWLEDDEKIEGSINQYIREDIAKAYFQAIRALNLSKELKENVALEEHFNNDLVNKILKSLEEETTDLSQVNLSHHLRLHFLSLDKTVVSFTDELSSVRQNINGVYNEDTLAYQINMTLVDGRWRIDALEQSKVSNDIEGLRSSASSRELDLTMRGINYYPAATPWHKFWTEYDQQKIEYDLMLVNELDYGSLRFFLPFEIFGAGIIDMEMVKHLDHFMAFAERQNIKLIPTLFDFPIGYELQKYPQYDRQLEFVLTRYEEKENILAWDLKNEADLDFEFQGKEETIQWLKFVVASARNYTGKPITIGWSNYRNADLLCGELDFVSFHYYESAADFESAIITVKSYCDKPVVVSEYGMNTYQGLWPGGNSETDQTNYFKKIESVLEEQEVSGIAWCLYDYSHAPSSVFGNKPWIRATQKKFGILRNDGTRKEVVRKDG